MDRDVVIKPLFGSEGRGLIRVSDRELAWRAFRSLERLGAVLYVQRFIPHPGYDYRVFVLGDRVLGAIRRRSTQGDWRTNVAQGARAEPHQIDAEMERLSRMAADSVGSVMAGIDLLPDPTRGGMKILEVNAVPGWRALAAATGVDVARALLSELLDHAR
jgi:ribosomal protein S6--L-glutamate ligase